MTSLFKWTGNNSEVGDSLFPNTVEVFIVLSF